MSTVSFTYSATTITILAPRHPEEPGRYYPMIVGETPGGSFRVADLGDGSTVHRRMVLHFRRLPDATDFTALKNFIENTVLFNRYLFTYTDPHAVAHTYMRYLGGLDAAQSERGANGTVWNLDMIIQKDLNP